MRFDIVRDPAKTRIQKRLEDRDQQQILVAPSSAEMPALPNVSPAQSHPGRLNPPSSVLRIHYHIESKTEGLKAPACGRDITSCLPRSG
jgi:hypothetical protein